MDLALLQLLSGAAVLFVLTLVGCLPFLLMHQSTSKDDDGSTSTSTLLSLSNCFACGVFLATSFMGLIPHVRHHEHLLREFGWLAATNNSTGSVWAGLKNAVGHSEFVVVAGFLLILLIEHGVPLLQSCRKTPADNGFRPEEYNLAPEIDSEDEHETIVLKDLSSASSLTHVHGEHERHHHHHDAPIGGQLSLRSLVLMIGLSAHSLFEGLALTLQQSSAEFVRLLVAVMLHEVLCALAFGLTLAQQKTRVKPALISILLLSSTIPLGMYLGFIVPNNGDPKTVLLRFVIEGLAAGTFVYVSCVEMISSEFGGHGHHGHTHTHSETGTEGGQWMSLVKVFAVCFGVAVFVVMQGLS